MLLKQLLIPIHKFFINRIQVIKVPWRSWANLMKNEIMSFACRFVIKARGSLRNLRKHWLPQLISNWKAVFLMGIEKCCSKRFDINCSFVDVYFVDNQYPNRDTKRKSHAFSDLGYFLCSKIYQSFRKRWMKNFQLTDIKNFYKSIFKYKQNSRQISLL